jgi:putative transposase
MAFNSQKHHRRSIRLKGYDYTEPGAYFVTICTSKREHLFGHIQDEKMHLNRYGEVIQFNWNNLPKIYPHVQLDEFVIMPDHIHGIIILKNDPVGAGSPTVESPTKNLYKPAPTIESPTKNPHQPAQKRHGLPQIIRSLKTCSATRINQLRSTKGNPVWQRGYYEHIVRNEQALFNIRRYIINNPLKWQKDKLNSTTVINLLKNIYLQIDPEINISMNLHS